MNVQFHPYGGPLLVPPKSNVEIGEVLRPYSSLEAAFIYNEVCQDRSRFVSLENALLEAF